MHAYLFIGSDDAEIKSQISKLAGRLHAKIIEFPLLKIADVRNLNNLVRLKFNEPTLIVCPNIQDTGEEALNAFLKNLEEPQENILFALTSPSTRKVLPTIVSRCQVVKITNSKLQILNEGAGEFMKLSLGEKLAYTDKIKDRDSALKLVENTVYFLHSQLLSDEVQYSIQAKKLEVAQQTSTRLKANGNVNLQLTNFVIQISNLTAQN
jgi:DNA polymerase III delta prime subunit